MEEHSAKENNDLTESSEVFGPVIDGTTLSYIEQGCTRIPEELGKWYGNQIKRLDLSFNQLRSVEGLEYFKDLEELILDSNQLDDTVTFPNLAQLHTLILNKNNIKDVDSLIAKIRKHLPGVTYISLLGNTACPNELSDSQKDEEDYQRYRYYVIFKLPQLKFLDSRPVSKQERIEAKRRGSYMRVAKPTTPNEEEKEEPPSPVSSQYTPLPTNSKEGYHKGSFGKCRYVYYGRHSEGNRFIRNNDL
ncbi:Leucine-rich melanocyte differentiation-associated protein [Holothuria leucospilota]|uniref:Leucine-rich melanocyte differentiation-associated protein n=1 Tax=Holothuria leucospilota TaxID=206669 RepID=A0A9Q0YL71_HOLLE|nr:Leucine-rich melanocyte differentiation-associated protein [Holothuria leucospilota]